MILSKTMSLKAIKSILFYKGVSRVEYARQEEAFAGRQLSRLVNPKSKLYVVVLIPVVLASKRTPRDKLKELALHIP